MGEATHVRTQREGCPGGARGQSIEQREQVQAQGPDDVGLCGRQPAGTRHGESPAALRGGEELVLVRIFRAREPAISTSSGWQWIREMRREGHKAQVGEVQPWDLGDRHSADEAWTKMAVTTAGKTTE